MKYLIVVDMQVDFITGSLGSKLAEAIVHNVVEKVKNFDGKVIFTRDTHFADYMNTQEGKNLPIPHCIRGTDGWTLYGKTAEEKLPSDIVIEKPTFPSYELGALLREKAYDALELVGVVTDICVLSNAIIAKAALPEAKISVDASCTATTSEEMKQKTFDVMGSLQISVMNR